MATLDEDPPHGPLDEIGPAKAIQPPRSTLPTPLRSAWPRLSLGEVMVSVAVVAVVSRWPQLMTLAVVGLGYLASRKLPRSSLPRLVKLALAFHGPAVIGFFSDCDHCRQVWAILWPVIPGGIPLGAAHAYLGWQRWPNPVEFVAAGMFTLVLWLIAWKLAARGPVWAIATTCVVLCSSAFASWAIYSAIRS